MEKTMNEIARLWLEEKAPYVKRATLAAYSLSLEKQLLPVFGRATQVTEEEAQQFVLQKMQAGLSRKTVKDILMVMKMVMKFGEKKGWLEHADWDIRLPAGAKAQRVEVFSVANQRKIMQHIISNFSFRNLGIYICLSAGLRIGEVCALTWEDIDVENRVIRVNKTLERIYITDNGQKRTELIMDRPKTENSNRQIPMSRELLRIVRPLKKVVNDTFFVLSNGAKPIEPRTYRSYYSGLLATLHLPPLKFHSLRHTFATRCIESKCDYKTVSVLLGHSNISTTLNLYVHPNMEQKQRCIEQMCKALHY